MKGISKAYAAELLAKADNVGPSMVTPKTHATYVPAVVGIMSAGETAAGIWTFRIPGWAPTPVNRLYDHHWASRRKHKQSDAEIVAHYGRGVPKAKQKRAVSLHVVFPPGKRRPDPDAFGKSLLDALVHAGILVQDSYDWARLESPTYSRGDVLVSFVTLEDV